MSTVKTIIIANQREFAMGIDSYLNPEELYDWRQDDFDDEGGDLFWAGDEKLVITSSPLNQELVADACRLLNYRAVRVVAPAQHGDALCDDIQNDPLLFDDLVQTIRASDCPQILVWGASPAYYRLIERLEGLGLSFLPAEVPPPAFSWMLGDFGAKAGFHTFGNQLAKTHPQVKIPEGFICETLNEAFAKAQYFAASNRPFLMKTNLGAAGWGTIVFNPASSLNQPSESQLQKAQSGIWASGPVMLEEYIDSGFRPSADRDLFPLIPTVDLLITPSGEVQFQFMGNMVMKDLTHFQGVALGLGALPPEMESRLKEIGMIIGTALSERGYRGWFDIDLVANAQGELYCNEINTRRTGPIHAFDIYARLKAQYPEINAVLSNDSWHVAAFDGYAYPDVKAALREVLYPINGQPRGLIITLMAGHGKIGFAIVGQNFADVMHINRLAEALVRPDD